MDERFKNLIIFGVPAKDREIGEISVIVVPLMFILITIFAVVKSC